MCQGFGLSPCLFNIFMNDSVEYLDTEETLFPIINSLRILVLLFANDFAVTSFTIYGMQEKMN